MVIGSPVLIAISFLVQPNWVSGVVGQRAERPALHRTHLRPGGVLLLAVLVKWRRPEARLLAALACVPQTPTFYDHVFVFVVPRTTREALALVVLTLRSTSPWRSLLRSRRSSSGGTSWPPPPSCSFTRRL